jgi:anthranilate phosphoribosyltransferase
MKEVLNNLFEYKSLDKEQAKNILINLAQGKYNHSQVAAFLTVYLMRSITVEELEGFRDAMLELCIPLQIDEYDAIDLCGTGGDGKDTFNISTLASFVVAGAGQRVAKHGNNGVSSVCGSSNVLAYFGHQFTNDKDELIRKLENVAPIRMELGVKTFFNMLGPMVNPSFPKKQLVGVFSLELARLYAYLYQKSDKSFMILHSLDGYDEVSLTGPIKVISNNSEGLMYPKDFGTESLDPLSLHGGKEIEDSAKIFLKVLEGEGTAAQNKVVLANAGMALKCGNSALSLEDALALAHDSLFSGKALKAFKTLLEKNKNVFSVS